MSQLSTPRLRDLCELISVQVDPGATPNAACIGLGHVPSGRFWAYRHGLAHDAQSSKFKFAEGDVLYGKLRPYLDKAVIATSAGVCTTELLVLRPRPGVPSTYVAAVVHASGFTEHAMSGVTGAHHPRTSWHHIAEFEIPDHSNSQRQRIGSLLSRIQRLIECVEAQATTALEIKSGAMDAIFSRGLRDEAPQQTEIGSIPESWQPKAIPELCNILSGGTPKKSNISYWKGDIPWVSGKDLKLPALDDAEDHVTSEAVQAGCKLVPKGTVLLLVRGMGLARDLPVAVINREMAFNQDIKALVPKGDLSGAFIRSAIYAGKERLLSQIVPSAHGTMTLNLNDVENFQIACPADPDEANEIAEILGALDAKIELHRKKRQVLEELFKALLHKLMTGEIDVNDLDLSALQPAA